MFQILINREEKENFFFKILKIEKRKRMKIQFFRARGSERGQYFSRFLEIRDSCSWLSGVTHPQGYINRGTCSYPELTSCHVLTSAYVIIFWAVARNAVNKSVWRKKTVLDFPSTNMQWISLFKHQQMWACFSQRFMQTWVWVGSLN